MRVKENNLRVYKCDLCKKTYSEYDGAQYSKVSLFLDNYHNEHDCCPACTAAIVDLMNVLQNNKEYMIYVTEKGKQE